jgi:sugar lactone lactonase YvrE
MNRRLMASTMFAAVIGGTLGAPLASARAGTADSAAPPGPAGSEAPRAGWPTTIALPLNFQPEGIAIGVAPVAYLGSRRDGSIYRVDLRTGAGTTISPGPGTPSLGLKLDQRGRLFVSGGTGGDARVIDSRTGQLLASYPLATPGASFINDVILTRDAAWFTDSTNPVIYKLALGRGGTLPPAPARLPLTGDLVYTTGTNANGITTTPDGRALLVVQTNLGRVFRVDPATGVTRAVDLGGESLVNGDGMLRLGRTLFVMQNRLNTLAVLTLDAAGTSARLRTRLTDPRFDVPTTIASFGSRLYLPNARFTTPPTPTAPYSLIAITCPTRASA